MHILRWTVPLTRVKYPANTITNSNNPDQHFHSAASSPVWKNDPTRTRLYLFQRATTGRRKLNQRCDLWTLTALVSLRVMKRRTDEHGGDPSAPRPLSASQSIFTSLPELVEHERFCWLLLLQFDIPGSPVRHNWEFELCRSGRLFNYPSCWPAGLLTASNHQSIDQLVDRQKNVQYPDDPIVSFKAKLANKRQIFFRFRL